MSLLIQYEYFQGNFYQDFKERTFMVLLIKIVIGLKKEMFESLQSSLLNLKIQSLLKL